MIAAPTRKLAPQARWVWALGQLVLWLALMAGAAGLSQIDALAPWPLVGAACGLVVGVFVVPPLSYARWRWDVRDAGIDIRSGTFTVRQTLVPWVRVQHVDTRRGIFEQMFGLATVVVHTAAGAHTIPMLRLADANELRDRIAELARDG